jgi:hypothetical protein
MPADLESPYEDIYPDEVDEVVRAKPRAASANRLRALAA